MAQAAPLTAQSISSDPSVLNGKLFSGEHEDISIQNTVISNARFVDIRITGFFARNITFKNTIFESSWIKDAKFENVIFENCTFTNAKMRQSELSKVHFIGGRMTYKGRYEVSTSQSYIEFSKFSDVMFENIELNHVNLAANTGSVFLRNLRNVKQASSGSLISGDNIVAMLDSVTTTGGLVNSEGGSIYAVNCDLKDSRLKVSGGTAFIEKSVIATSSIVAGNAVVNNCKGNIQFWGGGQDKEWFITGTELRQRATGQKLLSVFRMQPGTLVHIQGTRVPAQLAFNGGSYRVYDQPFDLNTIFRAQVERLDLRNVELRTVDWELSSISSGQWEDVTIYPPVNTQNTTVTGITAHNLKFPEGTPWKGDAKEITIKETSKPFTWEPVKVPTAEELGVKHPWPVITGGGGTKAGG